jgi:asparagine synthase (glutamine-hydrolysing)
LTAATPQLPSIPPGLDDNETFKRLDRLIYLRCTLLRDTDIFSMASGVEMRVPFVTDAFRSISESLRTRSKPGLATMFADPYLAEVAQNRKIGFSLPLDSWTDLLDRARPAITGDRASTMLNIGSIDEMLRTPATGPYAGLRKWSIAVLFAWFDRQPVG